MKFRTSSSSRVRVFVLIATVGGMLLGWAYDRSILHREQGQLASKLGLTDCHSFVRSLEVFLRKEGYHVTWESNGSLSIRSKVDGLDAGFNVSPFTSRDADASLP